MIAWANQQNDDPEKRSDATVGSRGGPRRMGRGHASPEPLGYDFKNLHFDFYKIFNF